MTRIIAVLTTVLLVSGVSAGSAAVAHAQGDSVQGLSAARPFVRAGEELVYSVRSSRFGNIGTATMRAVADTMNGGPAYRLSFEFSARIMLMKVSDKTRSWLDAETLGTLRYAKEERSPIGRRNEDARIDRDAATWSDRTGSHALASATPLDELAYIYFIRSVADDIGQDAVVVVKRHFDAGRNPVTLQSLGRVRVGALGDSLHATVIRMDARDTRNAKGTTRITFYIGDDAAHLPLRMDTSMPVAGSLTMTLRAVTVHGALVAGKL